MIKEYSLFYKYSKKVDVLSICFNFDKKASHYLKDRDFGKVIAKDGSIIAYNFFNISRIVKIKADGMIYLPSSTFIDLLNSLIRNDKQIAYKTESGYQIVVASEVKKLTDRNKDLVTINDGKTRDYQIYLPIGMVKKDDQFVLAKKGVMLPSGMICHRDSACSYFDLGLSNDKNTIYTLDDLYLVGSDFFKMKER